MNKLNFKRAFQTATQCLGPNALFEPNDMEERLEEIGQIMQGMANSQKFAIAFHYSCSKQVSRGKMETYLQMADVVKCQIQLGVDATSAWFDIYGQFYPYKSTKFCLKEECSLKDMFYDCFVQPVAQIAIKEWC